MQKVQIIFGRSSKWQSALIRFFDISPYSHVGIVCGEYVYESTGSRFKGRRAKRKGVTKTPLTAFKKRCDAWRIKEVWTDNSLWQDDCERMLSDKVTYDMLATVGSFWLFRLLRIEMGSPHAHNCSEFVNEVLHRFIDGYSPTVSDWWRLRG